MKQQLFITLVLFLVSPSFAVDDAAEAPADSSGEPGLTSQNRIALKLLGGTMNTTDRSIRWPRAFWALEQDMPST